METFGERLKRLRNGRGLSAGKLAMLVGVTEGAIRQMESGQTKSASFPIGVRLARVLEVSPDYLSGVSDDPGNATEGASSEEGNADLKARLANIEALEIAPRLSDVETAIVEYHTVLEWLVAKMDKVDAERAEARLSRINLPKSVAQ